MIDPFAQLEELVIPTGAGPTQPRIQITKNPPAALTAFYTAIGYTVRSAVLYWSDDRTAWYEVCLALNAGNAQHARGWLYPGSTPGSIVVAPVETATGPPTLPANPALTFGIDQASKFFWGNPARASSANEIFQLYASQTFQGDGPFEASQMRHLSATQNTASTRAVNTYGGLTNQVGLSFTAPRSGIVTIHFTAHMQNDNVAGASLLAPRVGTGTTIGGGSVVVAAADTNALINTQDVASEGYRWGGHLTVTGLTAGSSYNVEMQGRTNGTGTSTFTSHHVTVVPSP